MDRPRSDDDGDRDTGVRGSARPNFPGSSGASPHALRPSSGTSPSTARPEEVRIADGTGWSLAAGEPMHSLSRWPSPAFGHGTSLARWQPDDARDAADEQAAREAEERAAAERAADGAAPGGPAGSPGALSLDPRSDAARDYPFHPASTEMRRGSMVTGGLSHGASSGAGTDPGIRTHAVSGTYADSYAAQGLSGVNEGIAGVLGGPVDLLEMGLNGASWVARKAGVPAEWTPEFEGSFGGSDSIERAMGWMGSIAPRSADPAKQAVRSRVELTTELAGAAVGAALAARGVSTMRTVEDVLGEVRSTGGGTIAAVPAASGATRRAAYGADWPSGDIAAAIGRFAGDTPAVVVTETGKRIFEDPRTGVQVVEDIAGRYFRIHDPSLPGRRRYLDLDGNVPNNARVDGREVGRTQGEYNRVTHFRIDP